MRFPFRVGVPAIASLLVNGAMLAALFTLGAGQREQLTRHEPTVMDFAVLKGAEDGEERAPSAEPAAASDTPPAPAAPAAAVETPPPLPVPVPAMLTVPSAPVGTPAAAPVAPASAPAPPAATVSASSATTTATTTVRRGTRDGLDVTAPPGSSRSYAARVRSWLLAHKIYPKHARMRREQGVVRVLFVIDRTGRLIEGRLLAACGLTALDDEATAMLRRAAPYPAAPNDLPGDRFEITAPIEFMLPA